MFGYRGQITERANQKDVCRTTHFWANRAESGIFGVKWQKWKTQSGDVPRSEWVGLAWSSEEQRVWLDPILHHPYHYKIVSDSCCVKILGAGAASIKAVSPDLQYNSSFNSLGITLNASKITIANYPLVALVHSVAALDPTTSICARMQQYLESRLHPRL